MLEILGSETSNLTLCKHMSVTSGSISVHTAGDNKFRNFETYPVNNYVCYKRKYRVYSAGDTRFRNF